MYKIITNKTKLGKNFIDEYTINYKWEKLNDCYKTYSCDKSKAYDYCKFTERLYKGSNGKIISRNDNYFTYAFMLPSGDLYVITHANEYLVRCEK